MEETVALGRCPPVRAGHSRRRRSRLPSVMSCWRRRLCRRHRAPGHATAGMFCRVESPCGGRSVAHARSRQDDGRERKEHACVDFLPPRGQPLRGSHLTAGDVHGLRAAEPGLMYSSIDMPPALCWHSRTRSGAQAVEMHRAYEFQVVCWKDVQTCLAQRHRTALLARHLRHV